MVLVTRQALGLIDADLARLIGAAARARARAPGDADAGAHADAAGAGDQLRLQGRRLGRAAGACARAPGARRGAAALRLQFGGAVGTLASLGDKGPAVARRARRRGSASPAPTAPGTSSATTGSALGCEVAVLCGSLGKIGRDLALLAQAEVGEVAEPSGAGPRRLVGDAAEDAIRSRR